MIFFDETNPNKYSKLKKALVPFDLYDEEASCFFQKKRFGSGDGGYVLASHEFYFKDKSISVLSYGVGNDPKGLGFECEFSKLGANLHLYDGSVESIPVDIPNAKFWSENLCESNFKRHIKNFKKGDINILKMDIEGCEYGWSKEENIELSFDVFDQIAIEVHGMIEESPEGWKYNEETIEAKKHLNLKLDFLKRLNDRFYLFHIHGNNHSPRYVDFPDSLELTYVNKKKADRYGINKTRCPDKNVDEPNFDGRPDYILDFWI